MEKFSGALLTDIREKWKKFCDALADQGLAPPADDRRTETIRRVFGFSDFVARNCARFPQMADALIRSGDLDRSYEPDAYLSGLESALAGADGEESLKSGLRRFRRREMIRIAFRDLAGQADLQETLRDLSALADAAIEGASERLYRWHCEKYGTPVSRDGVAQRLVVLGMGKLGARELNFSSDIDLIFAFPEPGMTCGEASPITNDDFFTRLCRRLMHVLSANTADGFVFRVDADLRPAGKSGPLVMNFDVTESYYQEQGREWERYAWIKARVVAGDKTAGAQLLKRLNPFIFRRYLDYGVFESLREMKQNIALEVRRKGMGDNIKLGAGGIREIEFFGQIFQLIRGGVVPELQARPIQNVLDRLVQEHLIPPDICRELQAAYRFLRNAENRLQEFADAQTHKLPGDGAGRERLALSMGFDGWDAFAGELERHTAAVHGHFNSLLKTEDGADEKESGHDDTGADLTGIWQGQADDEEGRNLLKDAGYGDTETALKRIAEFREILAAKAMGVEGRERIDRLMPLLIRETGRSDRATLTLDRIISLIRSIRGRSCYISLLLENPHALDHLVRLADTSSWIVKFLSQHPVLLDELLDPRTLYVPPERPELEKDLRRRLDRIDPEDLEYQMDALRIFKQINTLRVAAADITDAIPLMRVSDHLSDIAETALSEVLALTWKHAAERHGIPACDPPLASGEMGFVVIAYGKLGGLELGYGSDLDMVFLHSGSGGESQGGRIPLDSTTYFARMGQRFLHMLTTHTTTGRLYEADMRLRPSGSSGILVCSVESFRSYQADAAWTWEKQALVRARPIAGDRRLMDRFEAIRAEVLTHPRDPELLRREIIRMRTRMKKELLRPEPGIFDLKQGDGGIVDIEFLVQCLVLLNACRHPGLLRWTDNVRMIRTLCDTGVIDEVTAYFLRKAYLIYRAVGHKLNLREAPAKVAEKRFELLRTQVRKAWDTYIGTE
ncbi:bifunctional [glutamate--ammonia ligase]-adenyly l-L-tyrosine phosphorylase/[glutamate--ammonia-ligase] ade nylyltransferase [Desulfonema ishimotonii]|uniref:Bifunctional [glutamate--ammonia ligase]-adenyly l-L-tyrosine phosphorylase/[glutamate--ammonia-ligase] ade nylyltransferase n=1 Tax=Desulfonema ishimotonii TaxID=45657 RepID=A0A401G0M6_9BACT|nr:bifunctional [glutamate--ammonia ligase]-adenylyl-L-tyrosine phosphorylase/[glutamate--ammonia-ligase] adenylyltransferase [Desulfonema ishimotonii]GBC62733.1 bifunctional [glutamate--ammonia ligase]-adenyly l-L-tyrosine phosphorylase/[glutamate--ammonia-ligase] ade nylyltransferase [Desulfonema ishimotonii]